MRAQYRRAGVLLAAQADEFSGESDDVYSIASDLAEKGCPQAKP
jgi:hypothetical protein